MNDGHARYLALVERVDRFLASVRKRYADQILCRKGCADCCRQFLSLWPVEAHHIARGLKVLPAGLIVRLQAQAETAGWSQCPLLLDSACALYEYRPILCRTYGYPFLSQEEGNLSGPLVSYCSRNFQGLKEGDRLQGEYLLDLDALNQMLVGANLLFLQGLEKAPSREMSRIPISEILSGWDAGRGGWAQRNRQKNGGSKPGRKQ
jgi:Fe-S-cluster containining protein